MINVDLSKAKLTESMESYKDRVAEVHDMIHNKTGAGNDFLGWVDLPTNYNKTEVENIKKKAAELSEEIDVLLVCGIGGSFLGARAAIEAINGLYPTNKVQIIYIGNTFSATYLAQVKNYVKDKEFGINVISKSGTTTETSVAFRIFKELLEETKGKEVAQRRIVATTDAHKGALKTLADQEGYTEFVVPDDVGGRYSVLTAVGLFPIAMAGIDVDAMLKGAKDAQDKYNNPDLLTNDAYQYGVARQMLLKAGYPAEMFVTYNLQLQQTSEWWKQLFGESEGKDQKGIFPASVDLTTDLHSMGQFIQDGSRNMFETVINIETSREELVLQEEPVDLDGLNYLAGKSVDFVNKSAMNGTILAHTDGQVPNFMVKIPEQNEFYLGELFYFFEFACGVSGYLLGVNPFNQPGVESYKKNMFALLGKPGYEEAREALMKRL